MRRFLTLPLYNAMLQRWMKSAVLLLKYAG